MLYISKRLITKVVQAICVVFNPKRELEIEC